MALTFAVPAGFKAPDQVDILGVPGNRFEFFGYWYYSERNGQTFLESRFDLLAWRFARRYDPC